MTKKNILLEQYLAATDAKCPKCNKLIKVANNGRCPECGEIIELTIQSTPRFTYSWRTGLNYNGTPVGLIFIIGFSMGVGMAVLILKIFGIL